MKSMYFAKGALVAYLVLALDLTAETHFFGMLFMIWFCIWAWKDWNDWSKFKDEQKL